MESIQNIIEKNLKNLYQFNSYYDENEMILNKICDLLLKDNKEYFVKSSIDSYNTMVDNIKDIMMNEIFIKMDDSDPNSVCVLFKPKEIRFVNQILDDHLVTVPIALHYKLSYYIKMEVKYEQTIIKSEQTKIIKNTDWIEVVKLPIMVGSNYCSSKKGKIIYDPLFSKEDPGGYFILKGNKKAIFFKPRIKFNEALILPNGKTNINDNSKISIYDFSCQVISKNAYSFPSFSHYLIIDYRNSILYLTLRQPNNDQSFNFFSVIKSISDLKDAEILNYLLCDIYLKNSQEEVYSLVTMTLQDSNKIKIDSKNIEILKYSIAHLQDDKKKVDFLLYCLRKLIRVSLKYEPIDDRDNYNRTKVMDSPGSLIEELFINYFKITKKLIKDKLKLIQPSKLNDLDILNELKLFQIEYMLKFFISSDHWGPSKKKGVCELIQPTNYIHQLECLRKIVEDEKDKNIILEKRKSRTDYQSVICSITTPTSPKVGLHKYLALFGFINAYVYKQHHMYMKEVTEYINKYDDDLPSEKKYYNIFLDGIIICNSSIKLIHDLCKFIDELKFKRRNEFSMLTVYYIDYTRLRMDINTHGGRLLVPVVRLKNNKIPVSYNEINKIKTIDELYDTYPGLLDYIDTYWMDHNPIALSMKEIHDYNEELKINYSPKAKYLYSAVHLTPYAQYSLSIALNAFASNQAAIRNCFLAKQLVSSITCNPAMEYLSLDKTKKHLVHGNLPLTKSPIDKYIGCSEIPIHITLFTEICSDIKVQEDAYMFNWNAIARGAILIYEYKTYDMFISFKSDEKFFKPIKQKSGNHNFSKLGPDGIIKMNEIVRYGDVLICKVENKSDDSQQIKPKIEYYDQYSIGRVCKIERYKNEQEAKEYVIVKICKTSLGESADKMSTDMGQKGVIGQIASASEFGHSDLNFISTVKCSPSAHTRLTGGQLIVTVTNYYAILTGNIIENNTFNPININSMRKCLKDYGFQENFLSRVYREDSQLVSLNAVDIVPLTFRRLKQLADDGHVKKFDSGNDPITKNPIKGKLGGSKIGRMEKDALEIHGVPEYIQSIINYNDKYYICNTCQIKIDNKDENCKLCNKKDNIIKIKIPAAFAAVVDYCLPLGVLIKMHVNENSIIT